MYVKIQKGNTQSFMLIKSDAQVTLNPRCTTGTDVWDYMIAQQETEGKCGDDSKNASCSQNFLHFIGVEDNTPFMIITAPNKKYVYGTESEDNIAMGNVSVGHVNIDGVSYLTEGNIYVLNDKGQTIQKI